MRRPKILCAGLEFNPSVEVFFFYSVTQVSTLLLVLSLCLILMDLKNIFCSPVTLRIAKGACYMLSTRWSLKDLELCIVERWPMVTQKSILGNLWVANYFLKFFMTTVPVLLRS